MVDTFDVWWMTLIYLARDARPRRAPPPRHLERRADPRLDRHRGQAPRAKVFGFVIALIVSVGFSLVPLAVLAGIIDQVRGHRT